MGNKTMFNKLKLKKPKELSVKELSVEQLTLRAKYFDIASWGFFILGVAMNLLLGFNSLSLINGVSEELSLFTLAVCSVSSVGFLFGCIFMIGCFVVAVLFEVNRQSILIELRIREVTTPLLERLNKLEKQIGRT
jgi:hypothetical protein